MDFWGGLLVFLLIFMIMSCCGYCCTTKRRGAVLSTPVVVTSATHAAPGGYAVNQMPPPQPAGYQAATVYAPYPTQTYATNQMQMPMPMPMAQPPMPGVQQQYMAPYPPAQTGVMNPPTYDMAVGGYVAPAPSGGPVNTSSGYEKQQPYNPSFTAH